MGTEHDTLREYRVHLDRWMQPNRTPRQFPRNQPSELGTVLSDSTFENPKPQRLDIRIHHPLLLEVEVAEYDSRVDLGDVE